MKVKLTIAFIISITALGIFALNSCKKSQGRWPTTPLSFVVPSGFPQPAYDFVANPLSEEGFQLGKKLFYDGRLSKDSAYGCASCHQPVAAFTTFEHDRSHGYNHSHTLRNAPGLANLAWYPYFYQDGKYKTLEEVSYAHITAPNEMGENMEEVVGRLAHDTSYQRMFYNAYGTNQVTSDRILDALKQFLLGMVSANSRYDAMKKGAASFSPQEQSGYAIFQSKCAVCHKEPLFTDFTFRNIGLPINPLLSDFGRMRITGDPSDSLKFRVLSLRNVPMTSYYAHDGRFSAFRLVIEHYRYSVVQSPTLDPLLQSGIQMTNNEEDDLVQFLFTLSDTSYVHNPRYLP